MRRLIMYVCTNCGAEQEELYRRYCPNVLKLLKCVKCGSPADKYIEYDRAIILVDLILLEKQAYRHLLYNSDLTSYWKLIIVLWLSESVQRFSSCDEGREKYNAIDLILVPGAPGFSCNFYALLYETAFSMAAFLFTVILATEFKRSLIRGRHSGYTVRNLTRALIIGGSGKLLGLLGIVWEHISHGPHSILIQGYTMLCLLTAYSVVCNSGKLGSFFILTVGYLVYNCASSFHSSNFLESLLNT